MKKLITALLAFVLVACLLSACGGSGDVSSVDSASTEVLPIEFVVNNEANYVIIRSEFADSDMAAIGTKLFKGLKSAYNAPFKNITDDNEEIECEILLGDTKREESAKALDMFEEKEARFNDFMVGAFGKKICIYAYSKEGYEKAVEWFLANVVGKDDITTELMHFELSDPSQYKDVLLNDVKISRYSFVRPRYVCGYLEQHELENLQNSIFDISGYKPKIVKDSAAAAEYEVIMGNCERDGVKKITNYDEYEISVSGSKIYINGGSAEARVAGIKKFSAELLAGNKFDKTIAGSYSADSKSYSGAEYKYVWGDEFDSPELNTKLWGLSSWKKADIVQEMTPQTFNIVDGIAYMTAYKDANDPMYHCPSFLATHKTMGFTYGYLEIKAVPCLFHGNSTAFWSTSNTANMSTGGIGTAEVDFVEVLGRETSVVSNLHKWSRPYPEKEHTSIQSRDSKRFYQFDSPQADICTQFHIFGFEWNEDKMRFSCDGEVYYEPSIRAEDDYDPEQDVQVFHEPLSLYICEYLYTPSRTELGEGARLKGDEEFVYQTQVDYVKLYQNNIGKLYV